MDSGKGVSLDGILPILASVPLRDLYARMLLTRMVDEHLWRLHTQGICKCAISSAGYEAAQVGTASCIDVRQDCTLPDQRDLGVMLTLGMTPTEVFLSHLQPQAANPSAHGHRGLVSVDSPESYWKYSKHNIVTGPSPIATQMLHAAGIAFASKVSHASSVTIAYCDQTAISEPDSHEAITFASLHKLPVVFLCESATMQSGKHARLSLAKRLSLPGGVVHRYVDGADVAAVYTVMQSVVRAAREGQGPAILELQVTMLEPDSLFADNALDVQTVLLRDEQSRSDPLLRCRQLLVEQNSWDEQWAQQLQQRLATEVEQALQDVLRRLPHPDLPVEWRSKLYKE